MATSKQENHEGELFIREVDEDLRHERQAELWKKYGNYVIGVAVAIVLIVAGYQGWTAYQKSQGEAFAEQFNTATALIAQNNLEAGEKALAKLAQDGSSGAKILAGLQEAALLVKKGDQKGAVNIYWKLADDTSIDQLYRGLATLLGALHSADGDDVAGVKQRLQPYTADGSAWRHTAREITGALEMKAGNRDQALDIFKKLSEDASAPQGARTRAGQMIKILSK